MAIHPTYTNIVGVQKTYSGKSTAAPLYSCLASTWSALYSVVALSGQ
jgi:hypothetical protein